MLADTCRECMACMQQICSHLNRHLADKEVVVRRYSRSPQGKAAAPRSLHQHSPKNMSLIPQVQEPMPRQDRIHCDCRKGLELVVPLGQKNRLIHSPEHSDDVMPVRLPYVPQRRSSKRTNWKNL